MAHRLSTIKNADKIFVFLNGKIVEVGKHSELMDRKGAYHDLVINQVTMGGEPGTIFVGFLLLLVRITANFSVYRERIYIRR